MNEENQFSLQKFFLRLFPASTGAIIGAILSLSFLVIIRLATGIDNQTREMADMGAFLLFAITFLSAIFSNILATIFLALANSDIFAKNNRQALMHVFAIIIIIFSLLAPFYFILSVDRIFILNAFLFPFTAIISALVLEVFAEKNTVMAIYKIVFSAFFVIIALFFIFSENMIPYTMMVFFALPISWILLSFFSVIIEYIFSLVSREVSQEL